MAPGMAIGMTETNKCYHMMQHTLSSYLVLIKIVDFAAKKVVERDDNVYNTPHSLTARRLVNDSRKVFIVYQPSNFLV